VDLHDLFYVEVYYTCLRSSGIRYVVPYRVHVEAKFFCANVTIIYHPGHAVAQSVEALRYKPGRSRVRFPMVSLGFFIYIILRSHYGSGVDSASNRNEYQEYFLWRKGGRCLGLTTLPP